MPHHVVESISELSAMMKVGAMAGSEKDAGFCSGCDEDDMSDLHSPSASEDSLEVQVMPISLKNKRKLAEPRKIQEGNPAPLKKRKYEQVEEQRVPDEESSRTLRSPSPFRPWSCTSKNVADSKLIAEKNTDKLCGFSSISDESATTSVTSSRINHRHHYCHHRHHNYHHHHYPTSGGDNRGDDRNNERDHDRVLNLNSKNAERDTSEKQCEGEETLAGRQRQDKTRAARTETDFTAASAKITTPETTLSSSAAASPLPRLQEEPLSLVLRGDVAARVPSHPAVNGSYEKNYSVGSANVSSASSSISSSSSSSCSSSSSGSSSSSSPSFSSLTSQQNHRTRSNGENSCSTTRTTTVSITSTITTPTTTVTGIQSGQPTRQYSAAGQQRNYKNMTRERRIEANARERTRVHTISAAFDTLRRAIPAYSHNQKLSKLSVLRIACSYIMTLGKIVNTPEGEPANGASLGACVDLVSRTIQTEGKLRKRKED